VAALLAFALHALATWTKNDDVTENRIVKLSASNLMLKLLAAS
jgi:hypothetical protein